MLLLNAIAIADAPEFPFPRCAVLDEWFLCHYGRPAPVLPWDLTPADFTRLAALLPRDMPRIVDLEPQGNDPVWWHLQTDLAHWPMEYVLATVDKLSGWIAAGRAVAPGERWSMYALPEGMLWYGNTGDALRMRRARSDALASLGLAAQFDSAAIDLQRFDDDAVYDYWRGLNLAEARAWGLPIQVFYCPLRALTQDGEPIDEATFSDDLAWFADNLGERDELIVRYPFHKPGTATAEVFDPSWPWVGILSEFAVNNGTSEVPRA